MALAEAGAAVTCVARREGLLAEAVAAMRAEGWEAEARTADMADLGALDALLAEPFDVVTNAAGMARHTPALETAPEDFDAVMAVNLRAAYFLSQRAARAMIGAGRGGSIIHVSSQMGHVGGPDRAVYCASKHGLEGMVKAMSLEWGRRGIRINTVCPTFVRPPLTEGTFADPDRRAWIEEKIALGRVGRVEDVMGAVLYLASDASALVTGSALMVDGGGRRPDGLSAGNQGAALLGRHNASVAFARHQPYGPRRGPLDEMALIKEHLFRKGQSAIGTLQDVDGLLHQLSDRLMECRQAIGPPGSDGHIVEPHDGDVLRDPRAAFIADRVHGAERHCVVARIDRIQPGISIHDLERGSAPALVGEVGLEMRAYVVS